ncbi:MAG: hypothetical protein A2133_08455 [Actinobacteria bacterium RBG_16_64_13]|nr:MAG: hypothetical protein A2133_08455 [Actinobacteria bacterium RBG_16_64_13]
MLELSHILASARCPDTARVFTQRHGAHELAEPARKRIRRALGGSLLRRYVHAVSGNTEHAMRYAVTRYGLHGVPAQVTYNGVDFSLLAPHRNRQEVRAEIGAGPGTIVIGSSGSFNSCKRFDRLVGLLAGPSTQEVVLVGDGRLRGALQAQAETLGASRRLCVTGLVDNVADYLQAMDIFVLPSSADESFGNSVVEAMGMGIPSIVFSDSPGLCEHIEHGETGFIAQDQEELASLVAELAADPGLRSRLGLAGAKHVRSKYSLEHMHESYRKLYETALARRAATQDEVDDDSTP